MMYTLSLDNVAMKMDLKRECIYGFFLFIIVCKRRKYLKNYVC